MSREDAGRSKRQQAWGAGDYSAIGSKLVIVSELQCESADLRANQRVLDVATGHGNTALSAARRGCDVTGIDFSAALLDHARRRAEAEQLQVDFREGDMEEIPFPNSSFDAVLSTFGTMFAADQQEAANQLLRVCRPGGKISVVNWTPTGANQVEGEVIGRYFSAEPDSPASPWTTEQGIGDLLGHAVSDINFEYRTVFYRFPSIEAYVNTAFETFGPFMKMVEDLAVEEQDQLKADLVTELQDFNQSGDETLVLPLEYLEMVAMM